MEAIWCGFKRSALFTSWRRSGAVGTSFADHGFTAAEIGNIKIKEIRPVLAKDYATSSVKESKKLKPHARTKRQAEFVSLGKPHPLAAYNFNNDASQTSVVPEARAE